MWWDAVGFFAISYGLALPPAILRREYWFSQLVPPRVNPPPWTFAIVCNIIYCIIAVAGIDAWRSPQCDRSLHCQPMHLWVLQAVLIVVWPVLFFGLRNMLIALFAISALLGVNIAFVLVCLDMTYAPWIFLPYVAWVAFLFYLNAAYYNNNQHVFDKDADSGDPAGIKAKPKLW